MIRCCDVSMTSSFMEPLVSTARCHDRPDSFGNSISWSSSDILHMICTSSSSGSILLSVQARILAEGSCHCGSFNFTPCQVISFMVELSEEEPVTNCNWIGFHDKSLFPIFAAIGNRIAKPMIMTSKGVIAAIGSEGKF